MLDIVPASTMNLNLDSVKKRYFAWTNIYDQIISLNQKIDVSGKQ